VPITLEPCNISIDSFIEKLNHALSERDTQKRAMPIKITFPESWNHPEYSSESLFTLGYPSNYGGTHRNNLPTIFLANTTTMSIYQWLYALRILWRIPFKFTITDETVILEVADYRDDLTECHPPHSEPRIGKNPLCPTDPIEGMPHAPLPGSSDIKTPTE